MIFLIRIHKYLHKGSKTSAFTLAEVLITLAIIGVVAAITIPTLLQKLEKDRYRVAWKKQFAIISAAGLFFKKDSVDLPTEALVLNEFSKVIKNVKTCSEGNAISEGCWDNNAKIYDRNNSLRTSDISQFGAGASCLVTIDDSIICFDSGTNQIAIFIDVNGSKKPNKIGTDIYAGVFNKSNYVFCPAYGYRTGWGPADNYFIIPTEGDGTCDGVNADSFGYGCSLESLYK